ncbi:MAG: hypothetical protein AAF401_13670 [Pseudomonadota bacterium]
MRTVQALTIAVAISASYIAYDQFSKRLTDAEGFTARLQNETLKRVYLAAALRTICPPASHLEATATSLKLELLNSNEVLARETGDQRAALAIRRDPDDPETARAFIDLDERGCVAEVEARIPLIVWISPEPDPAEREYMRVFYGEGSGHSH